MKNIFFSLTLFYGPTDHQNELRARTGTTITTYDGWIALRIRWLSISWRFGRWRGIARCKYILPEGIGRNRGGVPTVVQEKYLGIRSLFFYWCNIGRYCSKYKEIFSANMEEFFSSFCSNVFPISLTLQIIHLFLNFS